MKNNLLISISCLALLGCYPTADSAPHFPLAAAATVSNISGFQDCILDGLNPMRSWLANRRIVQQETRSDRVRVDTLIGSGVIPLSRTDIFPDGRVQIRIADYINVAAIDRSPERNVFDQCVELFTAT